MGTRRGLEQLTVRELICALSAVEDAQRRCRPVTPEEQAVALALAAEQTAVVAELRRRPVSPEDASTRHPHPGRVRGGPEGEGAGQG